MAWSRREMLLMGAGATLAACGGGGGSSTTTVPPVVTPPSTGTPPAPVTPLKTLAGDKGFRFGTAIGTGTNSPFNDNNYLELVKEQCSIAVAENDMKWQALRPSPTTFDFSAADALVQFGADNSVTFRGHVLLWEVAERYPGWFDTYDFGANPAAEAERMLTQHINTVCGHFASSISSWDVINELVDNSTGDYRVTPFNQRLGVDNTVDLAFATARAALPDGQLVYNDFMDWGSGDGPQRHRDGVLRLLDGMMTRGTPIDALGVQGHIYLGSNGSSPRDEAAWRSFLDDVTGMGLKVLITELDVNDGAVPGTNDYRDSKVADATRQFLDIMFEYTEVEDVLCWGLVDQYSWLQYVNPRSDGLAKRPLPFDNSYEPKPMRDAIAEAFEAATARA
ncbi:endo-1,4-beta-xylanase [Parvularcula sp. LCG005]|uniref:endo-1,4-beta-xylanase n=1 Tax=Parvularcula sp. LCG005 TaxID=3078805 RepID=UPI002943011C|nr:endo-1,4-beta-xylanase [Parvularcula sp. LCG005]WOI54515.1 endo-1,4-beta-xylanase [Parvularcula sp. LCG005]